MKILLVARHYSPGTGGMLTHIRKIAKHLINQGQDIVLAAPAMYPPCDEYDEKQDFPIVRLKNVNTKYISRINEFFEILKANRRIQPDVIIMNEWVPYSFFFALINSLLPFLIKAKVTCFAHGSEILILQKIYKNIEPFYSFLARFALKRMDRIFAVSNYTKDLLLDIGVNVNKAIVIRNGIDLEDFSTDYFDKELTFKKLKISHLKDKFILLTVSKLIQRKGHLSVLKSLNILQNQKIVYLIAGEGPFKSELKTKIKDYGLEEQVIFLGKVEDEILPSLYHHSNLFVMPSFEDNKSADVEGFGIVFLEANMSNTVVLGSKSGGIPDAIKDNVNGFLIDPQNSKQLADLIHELSNNKSKLSALEKSAKNYVTTNFTWNEAVEKLLNELIHLKTEK